ncbi:MAG: hypothetical protein HYY59_04600 [Candidatus Omnitrophica bacterium]|nr:hypothetical protein [Candidatus Omnitrophota bacterium]
MRQGTAFLRKSATVFSVLAWASMVIQTLAGLYMLVFGGEPVPIGDASIPARAASVLVFAGAALNWFLFMFAAKLTQVLLDIHSQVAKAES